MGFGAGLCNSRPPKIRTVSPPHPYVVATALDHERRLIYNVEHTAGDGTILFPQLLKAAKVRTKSQTFQEASLPSLSLDYLPGLRLTHLFSFIHSPTALSSTGAPVSHPHLGYSSKSNPTASVSPDPTPHNFRPEVR
jgi:hypothetical protein